jgi:upstream activation factor subunit UAF30
VTAEEEADFTRIIDGILSTADLETVTRKKIREGLETAIGRDLSEQKVRRLENCCHVKVIQSIANVTIV